MRGSKQTQTDVVTKLAKSIPQPLRPPLRRLWSLWHKRKVLRSRLPAERQPHTLPGELIVSLTSYPPRFATLHLTLRSLLLQSVRPDRLILWIANADIPLLPREVWDLESVGLEIKECDDLKSYKKLVPALEAFPNAFVVTADDDAYYPPEWLQMLTEAFDPSEPTIIGGRIARIAKSSDGRIAPFAEWDFDVADAASRRPSTDLVPEGVGGTLYPPRSLDPIVIRRDLFQRLCPHGDDLWFYCCARMIGTKAKKAGGRLIASGWEPSSSSLWSENKLGGNDRMWRALEEEFGSKMLAP
jgi:hypothetical protein